MLKLLVVEKEDKLLYKRDKKGTALIFMYDNEIDKDVLFQDVRGATLAP